MKKRIGFTLIEVMVVMVIIAVLATAGISSYGWYFRTVTDKKAIIDLEEKTLAILDFASDHNGRYPVLNSNFNPNDISEFQNYYKTASVQTPANPVASLIEHMGIPKVFAIPNTTLFTHPAGTRNICARYDNGTIKFDAPCEIIYIRSDPNSSGKPWFTLIAGVTTKNSLTDTEHPFHGVDFPNTDDNYSARPVGYGVTKGNLPAL